MAKVLTEEQMRTLPPVIAVDFDGTLVTMTYKGIGEPIKRMFDKMIKARKSGVKVILWTCRDNDNEDRELESAIEFCRARGLEFDAVNDNIPEVKELFQANMRKIYADIYIDDKARLPEL